MSISLPTKPTGNQYEEAVSARIRAIGYFTENQTTLDHEGRLVLELDVVASPASDDFLNRILVDAKKDTAHFTDIFKIYGWRTFLGIPRGSIVHGVVQEAAAIGAFKEICPKLNVFADHYDFSAPASLDTLTIVNENASNRLRRIATEIGWYQLIADRLALQDFQSMKKKHVGDELFERVRRYRRACHLAFFEPKPLKRAVKLYDAFQADPNISGAAVSWQATQSGVSEKSIWDLVRDKADYPWVQHVLVLETRARILIIKNAVEAALTMEHDEADRQYYQDALHLHELPRNFRHGLEAAAESPNRVYYPYILQLYFELFGGFMIDETDKEHLAALAGCDTDAVDEGLELLNTFFPTTKGWRTTSKEITMLKMVPGYIRGIGAFFRQSVRKLKEYSAIAPNMGFLLSRWHNAAYFLLEKELKIEDEKA